MSAAVRIAESFFITSAASVIAVIKAVAVELSALTVAMLRSEILLRSGKSVKPPVCVCGAFLLGSRPALARLSQIDDFRHGAFGSATVQFGRIIFSGRTSVSYSLSVTRPVLRVSSRSVVPFLCAVFAIFAALS